MVKTSPSNVGIFDGTTGWWFFTLSNFNILSNNLNINLVSGNPSYLSVSKTMMVDINVHISLLLLVSGLNKANFNFQLYNITDSQIMASNLGGFDSTNNSTNDYRQFNMDLCGIFQFVSGKDYDIWLTNWVGTSSYPSILTGFSMCVKEFIPLYA